MIGYVRAALHSPQSKNPKYHTIHRNPGHNRSMGKTTRCYQRKHHPNNSMKIIKKGPNKIVAKFLYFYRAIHPTILMALNSLATLQTNPTIETAKQITQFISYSMTHPDAVTEPRISGMIIHIYLDASPISERWGLSRAGEYFLLGPKSNTPIKSISPGNRSMHIECIIMRNVMASDMESELGGLFENCQKETSKRMSLAEMGHTQPPKTAEMEN